MKKCIQIWNPKEKTEFIKLLSEKTDTYNFTNVNYSRDCFFSTIQDDWICIYHVGSVMSVKGWSWCFEGWVTEKEDGVMITGNFVTSSYLKIQIGFFLSILWFAVLCFFIRTPLAGIIPLMIVIIITSLLVYFIINRDNTDDEEAILDFLVNLHVK